jgi:hypothetical protein
MTTRLAIILGLAIMAGFAIDLALDGGWSLFLLKRFTDLVDWMMFWR